MKYLSKGSQCFVEGRIQTNKWEDKDGNTRYTTEIVAYEVKFLGGKPSESSRSSMDNFVSNSLKRGATVGVDEDEIPF